MAPLIILVVVTLLARLVGQLGVASLRDWATATRVGLAVMFCFTAAAHFNSMRADLVRMVPPMVPNAELMVTFTGVCEILGAIGLLVPRTRRVAAVALIFFSRRAAGEYSCGAIGCDASRRTRNTPHSESRASGSLHCAPLVVRCSCARRAHRPRGK